MIEGFLLGVIVTASLAVSAFFLKFWRQTHDKLFLGFSAAFAIEGVNRIAFLLVDHPDEGNPAHLHGAIVLVPADPGCDRQ